MAFLLYVGCIKANLNIPNTERRGTKLGKKHVPLVRSLGGISAFDYRDFDADGTDWATFVPYQTGWQSAVWIEVDISKLGDNQAAA